MNNFYKLIGVGVLLISMPSYSHAANYEHKGISHAEAHAKANAEGRIIISQPEMDHSLFILVARKVLKKAYARIGKKVEFELYPIKRSLAIANAGITNGELARTGGLQSNFPDLIQVSVPIYFNKVFVYSKEHDFKVDGWQSLKPYKSDFIFGFKFVEQKSKGLNTTQIKSIYQGLSKLNAGRSDLLIDGIRVQCLIKKHEFSEIKVLHPPLDELTLYHYLHNSQEDIAEQLEAELSQMKESGEIALIQRQEEQVYLKRCN